MNRLFPHLRGTPPAGFGRIAQTLKSRNYRLFFTGQSISLTGYWMQRVAMGWLVYRLTGSPLYLGMIDFAGQMPTFLLSPLAGVWLDRWDLRRTIFICQILSMIQACLLAFLTLSGLIRFGHILAIAIFLGLVNGFELPARQSFVVHLVERRENLPGAIALNSVLFNGARLIGPSLGGIVIVAIGEGLCFTVNGFCYLATLVALALIKLERRSPTGVTGSALTEFRQGLSYAWSSVPIRNLLLLVTVLSFFGLPYLSLLPAFAEESLSGGAQTLGFLMTATGLGSLVSAVTLAGRASVKGLDKALTFGSALFGAALVFFSLTRTFSLSFFFMIFVGLGMNLSYITANTLIQSLVDDDKRNRVMGLYVMVLSGMAPIGSFVTGLVADGMGTGRTFLYGGLVCLASAFLFLQGLPRFQAAADAK